MKEMKKLLTKIIDVLLSETYLRKKIEDMNREYMNITF